jgi:hypothetical protein
VETISLDFEGLAVVPDPDEADSPEADHLFWESTAEDHLGES